MDERSCGRISRQLARPYDIGRLDPHIEIVDVDLAGDVWFILDHAVINGGLLDEADAGPVLQHRADL
ncbi:hypothetical protein LGR54_23530 [Ancylobacter sp. Lp-2]|uniref:hypothetical protein n=1 Tax=Ancylobacter sp. Lp-2 TaxID=2881339 RepID=UPI001E5E8494|nr:hypothetical protein [Ancylobacter sp. Lp-2]MCB4771587.1 hypothetical protein [Ancylobacter sp. Lp-2]